MDMAERTILAIDDNRDNLITLHAVIRQLLPGIRVLSAVTGSEGIDLARKENPDIVFLDVVMPGMDGFDVCRQLKADEKLRDIPVVFLTSLKSDKNLRIEALNAGADGFLSKPIDEFELHASIKAMLQIRDHHLSIHNEKERLAKLVHEKTQKLELELQLHRKTAMQLQEREQRYTLLFENMTQAFALHEIILDAEGIPVDYRFLDANPAFSELTGIDSGTIVGKTVLELLPTTQKFWIETYGRVALTGVAEHFDNYSSELDKHYEVWVFSPKRGQFAVLFNDITYRKSAEIRLQESEARFRAMIEHSPLAYQALDESGNYIDVNDDYCALLGYERHELLGRPCFDFWTDEQKPMFKERFESFLQNNSLTGELHLVHRSGKTIIAQVEGRVQRDTQGKFVNTHCVLVNITKQKKLQLELIEAKEKAEESDRLKSTFLANMSHEVRTPMNAIIGFAELLTEADLAREQRIEYTEIVRQRSYDLLGIINDILNISLIDAGEVVIAEEITNVNELLSDLVTTFDQLTSDEQPQKVHMNFSCEFSASDAAIVTDSGRLRQILSNLLSNAFKFTSAGTVTLGYRKHSDDEILFFVEDTGIGIEAEVQDFIFDRFRQADESSARHYGGTGLGLSISKELVTLMGGKIWVESFPGRGSTFYFTIPYRPAMAEV